MSKKEKNKKVRNKKTIGTNQYPGYIRPAFWPVLLANLVVFAVLGYFYYLAQNDYGLYEWSLQEDEYIEWATTWAFILASAGCIIGAIRERKLYRSIPWFYVGLSFFCFLIAMEEISWGQRLFGYRAPTYFLENNFQQEITVHNIVEASIRTLTLKAVILGYGILLPLLMLIPSLRSRFLQMRLVVSPLELIPAFYVVYYIYNTYPWKFVGELVEFMLGLCFLFAILFRLWDFEKAKEVKNKVGRQVFITFGLTILTLGLGLGTAAWSRHQTENNPEVLEACRKELKALEYDFEWKARQDGHLPFKKTFHLRFYDAVNRFELDWMKERQFAALTEQGMSQIRADFFIDPWNMSYWLIFKRDKVTGRTRSVIYSFGPNRKRDSNDWTIKGDDIGVILMDSALEYPYIPENELTPK
jgi:hypothetical protein